MVIFLYRWRIKNGFEDQFIKAWAEVTEFILKNYDSLGSRLHRGENGIFYGYAQWKSVEQRENAFSQMPEMEANRRMKEAIEESFPVEVLNPISDFLIFSEK
ncbi:MAG TPA: hypothetical protein PKY59_22185 [Pyrinomonadaceae bacterium]|nr:hypothetical protein [Pyrinomonadaceae bacterium]